MHRTHARTPTPLELAVHWVAWTAAGLMLASLLVMVV